MKKVVLITGVSKGLGKALALKFKSEGFKICGVSRTKPDFEIDKYIKADLSKKEEIQNIYQEFNKEFERLDVLINNAGIGIYEAWENLNEEDLRKVFDINFFSAVSLTKMFLSSLKNSEGTVINVSSVAGKLYVPYMGAYCASKFALNAFSYSLKAELKNYNINVLNLIVGRINTGFSSRALGSMKPPETPFGGNIDKFANIVYKAYKKRKREITYPYWYKFFIIFANLFPNLYDRISLNMWKGKH